MSGDVWYLDTSAAVKLLRREKGSAALGRWRASRRLISSDLLRTELRRVVLRVGDARLDTNRLLEQLTLIRLDVPAFEVAGRLEPAGLRSLDALHLTAAKMLGPDLAGIVTYDTRLAEAAAWHGIEVAAPTG